jgi:hypothetical protein
MMPETALPYNPVEVYHSIFEQAVANISKVYLPGALEMIREDFPELARMQYEAEDRINELCQTAKLGQADIGTYRQAVERWKTLHLRGIRFFMLIENG